MADIVDLATRIGQAVKTQVNAVRRAAVDDLLFAVTDADGYATDLAVRTEDGKFPDSVIDSIRERLGLTAQ